MCRGRENRLPACVTDFHDRRPLSFAIITRSFQYWILKLFCLQIKCHIEPVRTSFGFSAKDRLGFRQESVSNQNRLDCVYVNVDQPSTLVSKKNPQILFLYCKMRLD